MLIYVIVQGYEMRQYPSVKWACTELTYEREDAEEEVEVETDEAVATLKALQEYQSKKKDRKNRPQTKMFMKQVLFSTKFRNTLNV